MWINFYISCEISPFTALEVLFDVLNCIQLFNLRLVFGVLMFFNCLCLHIYTFGLEGDL